MRLGRPGTEEIFWRMKLVVGGGGVEEFHGSPGVCVQHPGTRSDMMEIIWDVMD